MSDDATMQHGRLGGPPSAVNLEHSGAPHLRYEVRMLRAFAAVDMAHTVMLAEQGILTEAQAGAILSALREIDELGPEGFPTDPRFGSILLQVERYLAERIGEDTAGRMHTGRSRNDQSTAASRLHSRDLLLEVLRMLQRLQGLILDLAEQHVDTYIPGYTHLQHAQPSTLAHYLLRHWFTLERDQQRIEGAFLRTNLSALGGAAMTGTSWPLDRQRASDLLGHERPVENAYDAGIFTRDYPSEIAAVLSILVNDVGRIAGDLYLWSTWEFAFVEIDDSLAGTSSIMPQKKNPHALERVRGLAGRSIGWLPATLGMLRSVSSSDLDLLFGEELTNEAARDTISVLALTHASLETIVFKTDVMRERAGVYWSTAANLADEVVRATGLPFRSVHGMVGRLVRLAIERSLAPEDVNAALLDEAAEQVLGRPLGVPDDLVRGALDPVGAVQGLVTTGSAHPDAALAQIATARGYEVEHQAWLEAKDRQLSDAAAELALAADRLIGSA
ncbi:MAG TPA: argininosuccinate lyase [Actinomycetota bacterium]